MTTHPRFWALALMVVVAAVSVAIAVGWLPGISALSISIVMFILMGLQIAQQNIFHRELTELQERQLTFQDAQERRRQPAIEIADYRIEPSGGPNNRRGWRFRIKCTVINNSSNRATIKRALACVKTRAGEEHSVEFPRAQGRDIQPDRGIAELREETNTIDAGRDECPKLLAIRVWTWQRPDRPFELILDEDAARDLESLNAAVPG